MEFYVRKQTIRIEERRLKFSTDKQCNTYNTEFMAKIVLCHSLVSSIDAALKKKNDLEFYEEILRQLLLHGRLRMHVSVIGKTGIAILFFLYFYNKDNL